MEGHIVRGFDGDILALRLRALEMGGLAIDQVQRAVRALVEGDDAGARDVMARAPTLADLGRALDEEIVALIARRQPVASDLRAVLTVGKVASDLVRVGNGARKIARLGIELHTGSADAPLAHFYRDVRNMARLVLGMLRDALDCFDRVDLDGAARVVRRDDEVDAEFQMALRDLVTYVMEDRRHLGSTIQTVFVIKALERVGDHARNIAANVQKIAPRDEPGTPATTAEEARAEVR
jgi:phosphate transport system protein